MTRLEQLRAICMALPGAQERLSHGEPAWFAPKLFVMFADHHHDERVAFWCAATTGAQTALIATDPTRFFSPPYVGCRGWVGVWLDGEVDWEEVAGIVEEAYRVVAPAKRVSELDEMAARSGLEPETS